MQREIKFRAWDNTNKEMLSGFTGGRIFVDMNSWAAKCGDIVLLQFTGLKDQNGKEIYEGDVLRLVESNKPSQHRFVNWEVYWDQDKARYFLRAEHCQPNSLSSLIINGKHIVIGNIYEKPGLLKA